MVPWPGLVSLLLADTEELELGGVLGDGELEDSDDRSVELPPVVVDSLLAEDNVEVGELNEVSVLAPAV